MKKFEDVEETGMHGDDPRNEAEEAPIKTKLKTRLLKLFNVRKNFLVKIRAAVRIIYTMTLQMKSVKKLPQLLKRLRRKKPLFTKLLVTI